MADIKDRVAIIGMGCTQFGELWDKGINDMIVEAAYEAYEDAGVETKDIQAAWASPWISAASGACIANPLNLDFIPVTRVENACASGADALRNACFAIACGMYDLVLVVGFEKTKDCGFAGLPQPQLHPLFEAGFTAPGTFALAAVRYFQKYGLSPEEGKTTLAKIAVKNHHNGALSPKAHFQKAIALDQVMNAPIISWPLGLFDCCPTTDGAAAAILTRADQAKNYRDDYVLVKGLGLCVGPGLGDVLTDYDYTRFHETEAAGMQAYSQAGINEPRKEISIAEVHDCFTITELIIYEDLGFSPRGTGREDVDAGTFALDGELPVNTDGGLKSFGHPIGASGLRMAYEVYTQLRGKAGPRQVKNPGLGITYTQGGTPGKFQCAVNIFGARD